MLLTKDDEIWLPAKVGELFNWAVNSFSTLASDFPECPGYCLYVGCAAGRVFKYQLACWIRAIRVKIALIVPGIRLCEGAFAASTSGAGAPAGAGAGAGAPGAAGVGASAPTRAARAGGAPGPLLRKLIVVFRRKMNLTEKSGNYNSALLKVVQEFMYLCAARSKEGRKDNFSSWLFFKNDGIQIDK